MLNKNMGKSYTLMDLPVHDEHIEPSPIFVTGFSYRYNGPVIFAANFLCNYQLAFLSSIKVTQLHAYLNCFL